MLAATNSVVENKMIPLSKDNDSLRHGEILTVRGFLDRAFRAEQEIFKAGRTQHESMITDLLEMGMEGAHGLFNNLSGKLNTWAKCYADKTALPPDCPEYMTETRIKGYRSIVSKYRTITTAMFTLNVDIDWIKSNSRDSVYDECRKILNEAGIRPSGKSDEEYKKAKAKREHSKAFNKVMEDYDDVSTMTPEEFAKVHAAALKLAEDDRKVKELKSILERATKHADKIVEICEGNKILLDQIIQHIQSKITA